MSSILIVNFPAEGHINPTLPVVNEMTSRGDVVYYITPEDYRQKAESVGAKVVPHKNLLKEMNPMEKNRNVHQFLQLHMRMAYDILSVVRDLAGEITFDYLFADTFGAGLLVRDYLNIPFIASHSSFAKTAEAFKKMVQAGSGPMLVEPIPEILEENGRIMGAIEKEFGVVAEDPFQFMANVSDLNIVYTSKYFQPNGKAFDESFVFIGPSVNPRKTPHNFPLEKLENKKVLYISMGTVVQGSIEFFQLCMEAFRNFQGIVVIAAGRSTNIEDLGDMPDHFIVHHYVPQLEILSCADVFITHGGMNSTNEGLYFEVPLVVIPHMADQPMVAARVEEMKAGMKIMPDDLSAEKLSEAVEKVLSDPEFKKNAKEISATFKESGGPKKAIQAIDDFMEMKEK
ncbi:macrolide family glycosyltransferase [Metabacillus sp. RGM 3146]|uniref:macrolide family glycosyltransferase n=1 Tax=Metabacillus sp. RGM 3146 TaxID=3401092 RepID=UPI003B9BD55F